MTSFIYTTVVKVIRMLGERCNCNALSQKAYRLPCFSVFVQICHKVSRFRKRWALEQLLMGRGKAEQRRKGLVVVEAGEGGRIVTVWKGKGK